MNVLLLGPHRPQLMDFIQASGDRVIEFEQAIDSLNHPVLQDIDYIVSYGYRHIIRPEVLDRFFQKAINIHISLLPWNRGADPNLWSFLEDTPKGVTIHYIDRGIDTGDILAQKELFFQENETLRTSYEKLCQAGEALFMEKWPAIAQGRLNAFPQQGKGSFHYSKDRKPYEKLLTQGWDTPVVQLIGKAKS